VRSGEGLCKNTRVPDPRHFTARTFWIVGLATAVVLCAIVAIPQWLSKQARLEVLRSHVGAIAQLAASVVDGDLHRQLLEPANKTPELYARTLAPLVRFHSAYPDIFYVYTMVERDGRSYFVVDTAAQSQQLQTRHKLLPSEYLEPFQPLDVEPDPDWLQRIAAGQTYVYPGFQRDKYGSFLSGHAPIYDSQGRYSGFVGVDFDLQYYLVQEASFRAISIGTLAGALLLALLIGYLAARYHYDVNLRIEQQYRASVRDELTSLLNRRGALIAVNEALALQAATYAAILVDVDDLKSINDNHGHVAGDEFLVSVADAIRDSVRTSDICARLGGDEFLIFSAGCDLDAATQIARLILNKVHTRKEQPERTPFGVSIGIDIAPADQAVFEAMYRRADQALYRAKTAGRNRYVIFDPMAA
jgi:diguanylate cyclase (GGDEF)-like protein